ncbi:hypothetical protein [Heyndrickxia sporothermodurans]|nr:hypothetical protein [Heyndrickxia sporothermodurans]
MILFVMILLISFYQIKLSSEVEGFNISSITYTDLFYTIFKGTEYQILDEPNAKFPFSWLILQMMGPFIIGGYVREDLFDQSSFLIVRAKHRLSLWLSKLLFSFTVAISMYLFFILAILLTSLFLSFSFEWSDYGEKMIKPLLSTTLDPVDFSIDILILPFLVTLLIVIAQGILTVFVRPIYAFFILLSALAVSVFSTSRLLPGSYSMILRHHSLDIENGFTWMNVFIYILVVLFVIICSGYVLFKKMDIFQKERD